MSKFRFGFVSFCMVCLQFPVLAQVYINEISVCNVDRELDPEYDYKAWVELYNSSAQEFDLQSFYFSDDALLPQKFRLKTSRKIPAKGFAVIWLNGEVTNANGTSLDMDSDGGFLSIANASGTLVDYANYPSQTTNVSYGRTTDGGDAWGYFVETTCRASNAGKKVANEIVGTPTLTQNSGFFTGLVTVGIAVSTSGATIYYTTDGSEPTPKGNLYQKPLTFDTTTVLRAKAFKEGCLEGVSVSATYLLNEREPKLPVVFLVTDTLNLYDDSLGIYCVGKNGVGLEGGTWGEKANYYRDWTRPAYFEYLDEQRETQVSQLVGISISGQTSRVNDQKSLKIKARKKYGGNRLAYDFFPDRLGRRYRSLVLRNGGQHNSLGGYQDAFLQKLIGGIDLDYQDFQPVVLYINGKYWGYLNVRDRHNEDYVYSTYGVKEENQYLIKFPNKSDNETEAAYQETFSSLAKLTHSLEKVEEEYQQIASWIEVDNALNYLAAEVYWHNLDWPTNNQTLFKERGPEARWRWVVQDLDLSFSVYRGDRLWDILQGSTEQPLQFFTYLFKNEKFKQRFVEKTALITASCYSPERVNLVFQEKAQLYRSERFYQVERWGGMDAARFQEGVNELKDKTLAYRDTLLYNLNSYFDLGGVVPLSIYSNINKTPILFNGEEIPYLPYDGKYFRKRTLNLSVPRYISDKVFKHWSIQDSDGERFVTDTCLTLSLLKDTRVDIVYMKGDWKKRTGFYLNEVSANNAVHVDEAQKYEDWIEIYNSATSSGNLAGHYLSNDPADLMKWQIPSTDTLKTRVPALDYVVLWCSKKPERGVLHVNFKLPKEGGTLYLSAKDAKGKLVVIDSLSYQEHGERASFGRYPDGGNAQSIFDSPTFHARNRINSYTQEVYTEPYSLEQGDGKIACYLEQKGEGVVKINGRSVSFTGTLPLNMAGECTMEFVPAESYQLKSIQLNGMEIADKIQSSSYTIDKVYDDVFLSVSFEPVSVGKIVIGLGEESWSDNSLVSFNGEVYNNASLRYQSSYTDLPIYNTESELVMMQVKNLDTLNLYLPNYGIAEALVNTVSVNIAGESVYPKELYSNAWYFNSYTTKNPENRRTLLMLKNVPNERYNVRILSSLDGTTLKSGYSHFRYQVNNSPIYVPQEDFFYNNVDQFIEFKNINVTDHRLVITSWQDPATSSGYNAPMNLIEITHVKEPLTLEDLGRSENQYLSAIGHLVITGPIEEMCTIYSMDGVPVEKVSKRDGVWHEIPLSAGRYVIRGVVVYVF